MKKLALSVLSLALVGLVTAGCSDSRRSVRVDAGENFSVTNDDPSEIEVWVGAVKVGEVQNGQEIKFDIATGIQRRIEFRETGGSFQFQGDWVFNNDIVLNLTYETTPPAGENLVVENFEPEDLHVYIDNTDVGSVLPGQRRGFSVAVGTREIAFREDSDTFRVVQGDLRFAVDNLVEIDYAD